MVRSRLRHVLPAEYFFVDNQILLILVSMGFVGLGAFLLLIGTTAATARQVYWHGPTESSRHLGAVLAAAFIGTVAGFVTYDSLQFPTQAGLFYVLIGVCGALWRLTVSATGRTYTNRRSFPSAAGRRRAVQQDIATPDAPDAPAPLAIESLEMTAVNPNETESGNHELSSG